MEANKELPSEMQCKANSLVLDTTVSKELILHSNTEGTSNIKIDVIVSGLKKSQECMLPTPLWTSSTGSHTHQQAANESNETQQASDKAREVIPNSSVLLDVHPLELRFCFEPNKLITCSLDLTNYTDEKVAFVLLKKSNEQTCFLSILPRFGIVDPRTTYTPVVIMNKHEKLPQERNIDLILQTSTYYKTLSGVHMSMQHFQNAEELGDTVHKVTLKGVCALQGEMFFEVSLSK